MKGIKKTYLTVLILVVSYVFAGAVFYNGSGNKWEAPESAKSLKNPMAKFANNERVLKAGAKLFTLQCMTCHGETGEGDGPNAATLEVKPKDLTSKEVQGQTDGELFWKISNGKSPMPTFSQLLNDNQRWMIVNYVRTLKK